MIEFQKRKRKLKTAIEQENFDYREFGSPDSDILVISWGSNEGAIIEALDQLEQKVRFLSFPYIFPRPDISEAIQNASMVFVIECNASGQFATLLEHDSLSRVTRILKYDGVRFSADEIAKELNSYLLPEEVVLK